MPLPQDIKTPWPPKNLRPYLADVEEASAWYSGDVDHLRTHYGSSNIPPGKPSTPSGLGQRVKFWGRRGKDTAGSQARQQLHVPLAGDIASTSADLLFAEAPAFTIPGVGDAGDNSPERATQERLDDLVHDADVHNTLLEAGEVAAALGGVFLRVAWDQERYDHPLLTVIHADGAAPDFHWGRLSGVTFWRQLKTDGKDVWRHLERHEPGVILHGLYVGTRDELGRQVDLDTLPDTADLDDELPLPGGLKWAARYVPNVLPNRKRRTSQLGRSDWQGAEPLMDALDETYTSWQRDIRLGQARIITREEALQRGSGRGSGAHFDADREVYVGLDLEPGSDGKPFMEAVQFQIRYEEHENTALNLVERIVSTCGYSPQSFGLHIEGRAETGTALRIREAKTLRTQGRKQRYWTTPAAGSLEAMLVVDREVFGRTDIEPAAPSIKWSDSLSEDPRETAQTIQMLELARAASTETRVKMAQPHLEGEALAAEVARVLAESGMSVPDPTLVGGDVDE